MRPFIVRAIATAGAISAALVIGARTAPAQRPGATVIAKARSAAAATNAHIEAEQRPDASPSGTKAAVTPPAKPAATKPASKSAATKPASKSAATKPASKSAASKPSGSKQEAAHQDAAAPDAARPAPDTAGPPPTIYREAFQYEADGRRDPFVSLLTTDELRPTLSDLLLTAILFDHSGRHSVATLRDITTKAQYRVTVGSTLGRMRVSNIRYTTVVFTIDEFGMTRQDSLVLRDSTRARGK